MAGAHEHDIAETARHQLHAPKDERAHHEVAQLGVVLDDREKMIAIHLDHLSRLESTDPDQHRAARKRTHLARELTALEDGHEVLTQGGGPDDLQPSRGHHEDSRLPFPGFEQHFTCLHGTDAAMRGDSSHLLGGQRRKELRTRRLSARGTRDRRDRQRQRYIPFPPTNGAFTACWPTNHTWNSFVRMTSLTIRSFVPSSPRFWA